MIGALRLLAPSSLGELPVLGGRPTRLAHRVARQLRTRLPAGYAVATRYRPSDAPGDRVPLVIVGPGALVVIEPRDEPGRAVCEEDSWWLAAPGARAARRLAPSPSRRAAWHATRVGADVAGAGFVRVHVEPVVLFTRARLADRANATVAAFDSLDDLVTHVTRLASADRAPDRTLALARALSAR